MWKAELAIEQPIKSKGKEMQEITKKWAACSSKTFAVPLMVKRYDWWRIQSYIHCRLHFQKPKFQRSSKPKFLMWLSVLFSSDFVDIGFLIYISNFCNCTKLGQKTRTRSVKTFKEERETSLDTIVCVFCLVSRGVGKGPIIITWEVRASRYSVTCEGIDFLARSPSTHWNTVDLRRQEGIL